MRASLLGLCRQTPNVNNRPTIEYNLPDLIRGLQANPTSVQGRNVHGVTRALPNDFRARHLTTKHLSQEYSVVYDQSCGAIAVYNKNTQDYSIIQNTVGPTIAEVCLIAENRFLVIYASGGTTTWQNNNGLWQPIHGSLPQVGQQESDVIHHATRSPDGSIVTSSNTHIKIYSLLDNQWQAPETIRAINASPLLQIQAFSKEHLVTGHRDGSVYVWKKNAATQPWQYTQLYYNTVSIHHLVLLPEGGFVTASSCGSMTVYQPVNDAHYDRFTYTIQEDPNRELQVDALLAGHNGTLKIIHSVRVENGEIMCQRTQTTGGKSFYFRIPTPNNDGANPTQRHHPPGTLAAAPDLIIEALRMIPVQQEARVTDRGELSLMRQ